MIEHPTDTTPLVLPLRLLQAAPVEARKWARYACHGKGSCWPITHPQTAELFPAHLVDVSPAGIGLLLDRSLAPGMFLVVQAQEAAGESSCMMVGRVVRTAAQGEGRWLVGCALIGKVIHSTSVSSAEYSPGALVENGKTEDARTREVLDEVQKQVREQLQRFSEAREALSAEQRANEQSLRERREALERQAQQLADHRREVEELEAAVAQQVDQAIPERVESYEGRHASRDGLHSSDTSLVYPFDQRLTRLEEERDAALAALRELQSQAATWASEKEGLEARQRQLLQDRCRLENQQRELHLVEVEMRESVEIAEHENRRLRAELAEERLYLARQRETLRMERETLRVEAERLCTPGAGAATHPEKDNA